MPVRSSQEYLDELRRVRLAQLRQKEARRRRRVTILAVLSVFAACTIAIVIISRAAERSRLTRQPPATSEVVSPSTAPTAGRPTANIVGVG